MINYPPGIFFTNFLTDGMQHAGENNSPILSCLNKHIKQNIQANIFRHYTTALGWVA